VADYFKFAWRCIKQAWRGCWTKANEWAALLGGTSLFLILYFARNRLEALKLIEAPTTYWGVAGYELALAVASVILAFLVIFMGRLVLAPATLYWEQYQKAGSLEADIEALKASNEGADNGPNWPIHELFSYLEPEVLDRPQDNLWQKAGDKIRDALSLGRLRIWGRPSKTNLGDWVGERAALRPIEKTYWEKAYFTYMFFDASAQDQTHCYSDRDTGRPAYGDLQVNRAEVLKLWPGEPDDLAEGYPNVRLADSPAAIALFESSERTKVIALLAEEKLSSWARVMANTAHDFVRLKGSVWTGAALQFIPKSPNDTGHINQTYLRQRPDTSATFYDICMNFAQLKRAWPSLDIRRSKCDII
jgi:hypothetical protein